MEDLRKKPKLTLVGAGPGDPELISIKGAWALAEADAVLYDALVHPDLLKCVPKHAQVVFVGKRGGKKYKTQEEINSLIVEYALNFGNVVRLKGGDPFVFGRGSEEIEHAEAFGIETEVIPGISSSIGVPGLQKIPVSRRESSESFWVITGTTKEGKLSKDIELAAQSTATIVILMGMKKLTLITDIFKGLGKNDTPIAIIENGSLPNEKIALGTIDTIVETSEENRMAAPAVIVIGEVVKFHPEFEKITNEKQLARK